MICTCSWAWASAASIPNCALPPGKWKYTEPRGAPLSVSRDFVLKIPATLSYGGVFTGPEAFAKFFAAIPGGAEVWESFDVHVDRVIESADYLIAQLTNTAVLKTTGKKVVPENV